MIEAVLLNIFAQAIWELGLSPVFRSGDSEPDPERQKPLYETSVQVAVEKLRSLEIEEPDDESLSAFLSDRSVQNLITSIFVFRLDDEGIGVDQARIEFLALWAQRDLGSDKIAGRAFTVLLSAAEDVAEAAIRDGILSAHEARAAARHRMMLEHLDAMERRTRLMIEKRTSTPEEVDRFEIDLRREVHSRHGTITPPDFYGAERVPIDALYVTPHLSQRNRGDTEPAGQLTVDDWLSHLEYGVVLGDPGGGKSTLASKLCHVLSGTPGGTVARRSYTPVMVTLREYSATRKDRGISIAEYIGEVAASRYQLDVPPDAVEYLLLAGRLIVIFDGLDELLETQHRQHIRDDVESFQRRFPATKLLVTSRAVGYERAPLNSEVFHVVHLSEFTDEQVEEYAQKWFRLEKELSPSEQAGKAESFIGESRAVPDLRTNPLLLALMCNFYVGQNYLPRHLPEVYETCAKMLFETWDRSRGIAAVLPIAEHIRPAMRYLALWIYEDESLQGGASERELVEKAVEFLMKFRFDDEFEARNAAEAFIEFCAGRAWVFTDTGTTADGEKLFQFTHRTFLEYFAADHLVATTETTADLSEYLTPRVAAREWWVVALVAYQLKSKNTLTASDQLLQDLIDRSKGGSREEQGNLLLFASECLAFLVPSPGVVRALGARATEFLIEAVVSPIVGEGEAAVSGLGIAMAKAGAETRKAVAGVVASTIKAAIESSSTQGIAAALCLAELRRAATTPEALVVWGEMLQEVRDETLPKRLALAKESAPLAISLANELDLSIEGLVKMHGLDALFDTRPAVLEPQAFFSPILVLMAQWTLQSGMWGDQKDVSMWSTALAEAGTVLLCASPPWHSREARFFGLGFEVGVVPERYQPVSRDAQFGLALVLAMEVERRLDESSDETHAPQRVLEEIESSEHPFIQFISPIVSQRLGGEHEEAVSRMKEAPFTPSQKEILGRWMRGEVDFLEAEVGDAALDDADSAA